jgi:hypothetical protein
LGNLQPGNTFPPINKLKWDRCTQFAVLLVIFSLLSLLVYFLRYKKLMYFLKSSGIHYKRNEGLGGRGGGCRSFGPCAHTYVPLMSVTYSLNLLVFKVNQIVVWLAGAPLCPGLHNLLSATQLLQPFWSAVLNRGYVQLRKEHVRSIPYTMK